MWRPWSCWSTDPDTSRGGYSAQESALWRWWLKEMGVQFIYVDPFNNYTSVKHADKWIGPRMGTDTAIMAKPSPMCGSLRVLTIKEYVAQHGHRFEEFKNHILGLGPDGTPKTPKWAEELSLVPAMDIKAIARQWAKTVTISGSGMRGGFGGACRHSNGTEYARLCVLLSAMQGMGKPGRAYWSPALRRPHELQLLVRRLL